MTARSDVLEAVSVIKAVLAAVVASVPRKSGILGAQLTFAAGTLTAGAETAVRSGTAAPSLLACFNAARTAGATLSGMAAVRAVAAAQTPSGVPGGALTATSIRFCLSQEARILAATKFVSRDDVDRYIGVYDAAFDLAEAYAADTLDIEVYRALVTLHAATMHDLTTRSRPLPRMIAYSFGRSFSAVGLAHRLYGDPTRAAELVAENHVIHPYFCPRSGQALSA